MHGSRIGISQRVDTLAAPKKKKKKKGGGCSIRNLCSKILSLEKPTKLSVAPPPPHAHFSSFPPLINKVLGSRHEVLAHLINVNPTTNLFTSKKNQPTPQPSHVEKKIFKGGGFVFVYIIMMMIFWNLHAQINILDNNQIKYPTKKKFSRLCCVMWNRTTW